MNRWYLGSMNDALFIIDGPPRPSNDDVWHDQPNGPLPVSAAIDERNGRLIVDAHNAAIDALNTRTPR